MELRHLQSETHAISISDLQVIQVETCLLRVLKGTRAGEFVNTSKDVIRIGAHPKCDMIINDDTVSRFHCEIHKEGDHYVLIDQGSTNGTYVDNLRIKEVYLHIGCEFTIGNTILAFSNQIEDIKVESSARNHYGSLIGSSDQMRSLYGMLDKIAPSDLSVVIQGETGTGKELVAQALHDNSRRTTKSLVVFDCSAVPEYLIESELFGHEKGSFSGAIRTHQGVFEQAEGGTLFLDELGELSIHLQPKLLRALESGVIRRVGGERSVRVDVRVVSATNRDLETMVQEGKFRQDLFYRLAKVQVVLSPLRNRSNDVVLIANHFIKRLNKKNQGYRSISGLHQSAIEALKKWEWPGNVRELRNVIERAYTFADHSRIYAEDLSTHIHQVQEKQVIEMTGPSALDLDIPESCSLKEAKERIISSFEKEFLLQLLDKHRYNISAVSREAGIDRRHVYRLIKKYQLDIESGR
jgi:transcriptional regulator with GAF, ATPase, and Fis domain